MGYTFLFTTEVGDKVEAVKFEYHTSNAREFTVTILSLPEIPSFKLNFNEGKWHIHSQVPHVTINALEDRLVEAAMRYQR